MSAGYPIDKTSLDNRMGQLVFAVRMALSDCVDFWFNAKHLTGIQI